MSRRGPKALAARLSPAARRLGGVSVAEIASRVVGFLAFPFVTRALGPTEFGSLSFALAVTSWVHLFSAMGFYSYGLREVAQKPDEVGRTVGELTTLSLVLALLGYLGIVAYVSLVGVGAGDATLLLLTGATIPVSAVNLSWAFIGAGKAGMVSVLTLLTNVVYAVLVIVTVRNPGDVAFVPAWQLLQFVLIGAGLIVLARRYWGRIPWRLRLGPSWLILRGSIPLGMGQVMAVIYNRLDLVMVAVIRGRTEAGLYGAAYRLMEAAVFLPASLLSVAILPSIMAPLGRDQDEAARKAEVYWRHFLVLAIPVLVGGTCLRRGIVTTVLGDDYAPSADVFAVLSANLLIGGAAAFFAGSILVGLRRSGAYFGAVAAGAAANVALNVAFIPRYGMMAAAIATLAAQAAVALFAFLLVRRYLGAGLRWASYLVKPLVAGTLMAVPLMALRNVPSGLWLAGVVGSATYALAIMAMRGVDLSIVFGVPGRNDESAR